MDVLGMCLPYLKSIFNRLSEVLFSLGMTWIHSFSVMLVWERSKVTVWEKKISKSIFWTESFRYVSALSKKLFLIVSV